MKIKITKTTPYDPYNIGDTFNVVDINVASKILNKEGLFVQNNLGKIFLIPFGQYKLV